MRSPGRPRYRRHRTDGRPAGAPARAVGQVAEHAGPRHARPARRRRPRRGVVGSRRGHPADRRPGARRHRIGRDLASVPDGQQQGAHRDRRPRRAARSPDRGAASRAGPLHQGAAARQQALGAVGCRRERHRQDDDGRQAGPRAGRRRPPRGARRRGHLPRRRGPSAADVGLARGRGGRHAGPRAPTPRRSRSTPSTRASTPAPTSSSSTPPDGCTPRPA